MLRSYMQKTNKIRGQQTSIGAINKERKHKQAHKANKQKKGACK